MRLESHERVNKIQLKEIAYDNLPPDIAWSWCNIGLNEVLPYVHEMEISKKLVNEFECHVRINSKVYGFYHEYNCRFQADPEPKEIDAFIGDTRRAVRHEILKRITAGEDLW